MPRRWTRCLGEGKASLSSSHHINHLIQRHSLYQDGPLRPLSLYEKQVVGSGRGLRSDRLASLQEILRRLHQSTGGATSQVGSSLRKIKVKMSKIITGPTQRNSLHETHSTINTVRHEVELSSTQNLSTVSRHHIFETSQY